MDSNKSETRICPRCTGTMVEGEHRKFVCVSCGYEATEQEIDRETGDSEG